MTTWAATQRNLRSRWMLLAASVAGLLLAAVLYSAWVYGAASNVENLLDEAESLDVAAIAAGDEGALATARTIVDESESATSSLSGRLGPARVAAAAFGWLPWIGDQLRAPGLFSDRAEVDLRATRPLIAAADDLFTLQELLTGGGLAGDGVSAELDSLVSSLEGHAEASLHLMADVSATAAKMDGLSLIGLFDSRARRITSLENRLLSFGNLLVAAPSAVSSARDVAVAASDVMDELGGASTAVSLEAISAEITRLAIESEIAAVSISQLELLVVETMPGTGFSALVSDLSASMNAVADLSSGLSTITGLFEQALAILKESGGQLLSNGDELERALVLLVSQRDILGEATDRSAAAAKSLSELIASGRAEFFPDEVNDALVGKTASLVDAGSLMRDGPELLLGLIAADTTKTYLMLGQTSDELRAAGGFTSSAWTLTFSNGALTNTKYIPILDFDDRTIIRLTPPSAEPLAYYMNAGALYLRDVGWEPDYASVGRLAADLYRINQGSEIDGVIAVTQWGIIRLVEAVGGIEVEGDLISPSETLSVIEERTDSDGTGFLQQLFVGLLNSLRGDASAGTQFELLQALKDITDRKDLMLFSVDGGEQELIESLGWAGRFPVNGRDRLALVDSNVGWSKSDRSIERSAVYTVDLMAPEQPAAELTVSYRSNGSEIGRNCDLQSPPVSPQGAYNISRNSCYWNYVRSYVAVGAVLITAPDLPLPPNSVPDQLNLQEAGSPTFSHEFDEYGDHFAGLLAVAPGEEETFTVSYLLPGSVVEKTDSGLAYELSLVAQPGARGRSVIVKVRLPAGQSLGASSHAPASITGDLVTFEFDLQTDQLLRVEAAAS